MHTVLSTACWMWLGTVWLIIKQFRDKLWQNNIAFNSNFPGRLHKAIPESITSRISTRNGLKKPTPSRCPLAFLSVLWICLMSTNNGFNGVMMEQTTPWCRPTFGAHQMPGHLAFFRFRREVFSGRSRAYHMAWPLNRTHDDDKP